MTDLSRWRLEGDGKGRQVWNYVEAGAAMLQSQVERYQLGLDKPSDYAQHATPAKTAIEAARRGISFVASIQSPDGHLSNDYGGPMFLLPGLVFTCHLTKTEINQPRAQEMIRYLKNHANDEGGWGIHVEGKSTIFGTAMNYVTLRILGVSPDDPVCLAARNFLHKHGGATSIPSWGKFWLAAMGCYDWEGLVPLAPELWVLPYWLPFHPGRWWCHCRQVYLPMTYIYGKRLSADPTTDPLVASLRQELYVEPYDKINWPAQRSNVHELDTYTPHSMLLRVLFSILGVYEKVHSKSIRQRSIDWVLDLIRVEDESTHYIDIGPVNKTINMLVNYYQYGADSQQFRAHQDRIWDYLWLASDGMKMQGYNGSQLWDTAFATQAIIESGLGAEFKECLRRAHNYVDVSQVREDVPDYAHYYRHVSKGAWPFSTVDHGWPISDCTAEGLKAAMALEELPYIYESRAVLDDQRYFDAVNVILSMQNPSGGWATYELKRGPNAVELLNAAEVFYGIMVDYEHVECTSACVQALCRFKGRWPTHRKDEVAKAIEGGVRYIKSVQRPDGSWMGNWAVCFLYGTWFGVEGLIAAGEPVDSPVIRKACEWLVSVQNAEGGWGETFESCTSTVYCDHPETQASSTGWALLALLKAQWDSAPIIRGVRKLVSMQQSDGRWPKEDIKGVFNRTVSIEYDTYRLTFPIWALGRFAKQYPQLARL